MADCCLRRGARMGGGEEEGVSVGRFAVASGGGGEREEEGERVGGGGDVREVGVIGKSDLEKEAGGDLEDRAEEEEGGGRRRREGD